MSRTFKDIPWKHRDPENVNSYGWAKLGERQYLRIAGVNRKKKKRMDTEHHWMTTPSWWVRLMMTRPQRAAGRGWEKKIVQMDLIHLDDLDSPSVSRKPHVYYW